MAICGFEHFELYVKVCILRYAGATGNSDFWRQDCVWTVHIIVSLCNCVSLFIGFLNLSIIPQPHSKVNFYRTRSDISCDGQVSVSCRSRCWLVEAHHGFCNLSYYECCWISAIMHIGIYTWPQHCCDILAATILDPCFSAPTRGAVLTRFRLKSTDNVYSNRVAFSAWALY